MSRYRIKRLPLCRGRPSMYPFRVLNSEGRILKAFARRADAESYVREAILNELRG